MKIKSFININNYIEKKVSQSLKLSLIKKFNITLDDYLTIKLNKEIKKCNFCECYSDYKLSFDFEIFRKGYLITDFKIIYDKLYCKGKNKKCEGKKLNPNSIEFVSKSMNLSKEDAIKHIHNRNKSPFYKENHKDIDSYKKYQRRDIEFFNGSEKKFNDFKNKLKYSHTLNYYIDKYGEEKGKNIYEKINEKKDSSSLLYFIKKNKGNEEKALIEFNNKNDKCIQNLSNYIKRHGEEDGIILYNEYKERKKKMNSLDNYIKKYGNIEGKKRRKEWLEKITKNNWYSNESAQLFDEVEKEMNIKGLRGNNEYFLYDKNKNIIYYYDFTLLEYKIIIEYNGKIWHPNKEIYSDEEWNNWKHPFNKELKADDVYKKDIDKINLCKDFGFDILIIWSFEKNKKEKIINFIQNKNKQI
jgi:hypothetical protein